MALQFPNDGITHPGETLYFVIIHTDAWAGNFSRPLCAWMTGRVGDCGMGNESSILAYRGLDPADPFLAYFTEDPERHPDIPMYLPVCFPVTIQCWITPTGGSPHPS